MNLIKVPVSRKIMLFRHILFHADHINGIKMNKHSHSLNHGVRWGHDPNACDEWHGFCAGALLPS
ncbi:MAG: hypothetical protein C5S49_01045 [Candidatus Methanogaster sp.]|nr:MAG: hypothetical protein C5S49_01045 [ANME-2 cluster archaeon]